MKHIKECEAKHPKTCEEFKNRLNEMYDVFCRKQLDYGPANIMIGGNVEDDEDRKMALLGIWIRSNDKMERIKNLMKSKKTNNESVEDSYLDLANYSIISLIVKSKKWGS
jgi:hypothetical protein